ncbi:MAG TPA: AAA family ATPase [Mucilaginibacter sp.]|nr:AAA family ATPase [Mucilaginibacter sp.]
MEKAAIKIKDFKKITDEICINELANVNYLVGVNGSGKSSILSAVSFLLNGQGSAIFLKKDGLVKFQKGDEEKTLDFHENGEVPTITGELKISVFLPDLNIPDKAKDGAKYTDNYSEINHMEMLDWLNESINLMGLSPITAEREINIDPIKVPRLIFLQDGLEIDLLLIADGIKAFNDIRSRVLSQFNMMSEIDAEGTDQIFILIEEPESFLHPTIQKLVPGLFHSFISSLHTYLKSRVCFLVATHSPFIISASSIFEEQKTYLLSQGHLCDLDLNIVSESLGYSGNRCAWVVGQMLGAVVTDLGYPENYCILEEYSLQLILDHAREKNIIKNIQFVSASGESNVIKLKERMDNVEKLNTLIKCNPYYDDKYLIIIDSVGDFDEPKKEKFNKIRNKLGTRFIELKEKGLEDYYKNLDKTIAEQCTVALSEEKDSFKKGLIKAEYAKKILLLINAKDDFIKLFNGELNNLIK